MVLNYVWIYRFWHLSVGININICNDYLPSYTTGLHTLTLVISVTISVFFFLNFSLYRC